MGGTSHWRVLREPGVRWLVSTSLVARLPAGMTSLAIILRVSHGTGSYADAGAVTASFVVAAALLGPVLGRFADRFGRRPVLVAAAVANAAGVVALARVPPGDEHLLLVVAALAGAVSPPVAASVRSLWADLVGAGDRDALYAVDSTLQELTFVLGPTLVALLGTLLGSSAPLVASGLFGLVGTIALVVHPAVAPLRVPHHHLAPGRVLTRPLVVLLTSISLLVLAFGALEVGIVAYAGDHHAAHQSGLLLAAWSFGSMLGGFAAGTRATAGGARALPPLLATSAAGFALLAVSPGVGPLYPLVLLAGIAIAPSLGCIYGLAGKFAPLGAEVEAFSWLSSGILVGAAIGAALGGQVVQHLGSRVDFVTAAGVALAAGAATWLLPRTPRGPSMAGSSEAASGATALRTGA